MNFRQTGLSGAYLIEPERIEDERGYFSRIWCAREFAERGLSTQFSQCSVSWNQYVGTLRGLHYQRAPHAEAKLVRVTRGRIFDVIVDLRPASPTRLRWFGGALDAENGLMMYVPEGFAHGFQTLSEDCELLYLHTSRYAPEAEGGIDPTDPAIGIEWPLPIAEMSERDRSHARITKDFTGISL